MCACMHSDAQVSRDQRVRVLEEELDSTLGTAMSPLFRGGGLQSCCNGTPGSGGYEIVGSVTAREFIAGTCRETLWFV